MKKNVCFQFFILLIMISSNIYCDGAPSKPGEIQKLTPQNELDEINERIVKLEKDKTSFKKRADFSGQEANRLLFVDYATYRMYLIEEEHFNQKAQQLDVEINKLKKRKQELEKLIK